MQLDLIVATKYQNNVDETAVCCECKELLVEMAKAKRDIKIL